MLKMFEYSMDQLNFVKTFLAIYNNQNQLNLYCTYPNPKYHLRKINRDLAFKVGALTLNRFLYV